MKLLTPALTALMVLCASWSASALAGPSSLDRAALAPSVESKSAAKSSQLMTASLPSQVGKVASILPGDFIPGVTSAIVLGDKRGSLCYETQPSGLRSRTSVAAQASFCKPIVSHGYKDVIIRRVNVGNGNHGLLFTVDPTSKASAANVKLAAHSFMAGLERAQKSLILHAAKPRTVQSGLVAAGGSCGYDDEDSTPTCQGDGGGGGGGSTDYPGSGGDWGDPTGGAWATSTGCVPIPAGWLCTGKRDVPWSDPWTFPVSPSGPSGEPKTAVNWNAPWFPQSWCNHVHILCSAGQEPEDNDRGDNASLSGKTLEELYQICEAIYEVEMDVCVANKAGGTYSQCAPKAANRLSACMTTARRLTDSGAHKVP